MIDVVYRACGSDITSSGGSRPSWFSKISCFNSFWNCVKMSSISVNFHVIYDGPESSLLEHIKSFVSNVTLVNFMSNEQSLDYCYDYMENNTEFDRIYLLEDDYLHKPGAIGLLVEGIDKFGLVTLQDHPDRYTRTDDIVIADNIYITETSHWRTIESTTGTWAVHKDVFDRIKVKAKSFNRNDRDFFRSLILEDNIRIFSPMPGYSTHVDYGYMTPFADWEKVNELNRNC